MKLQISGRGPKKGFIWLVPLSENCSFSPSEPMEKKKKEKKATSWDLGKKMLFLKTFFLLTVSHRAICRDL